MAAEEEPPTAFHSYPPAVVFVPPPPPLRMRGGTIFSCAEGHRLRLIPSLLSPMVMVMTVVVADLKGCESGRSTDRLTQNGLQTAELDFVGR